MEKSRVSRGQMAILIALVCLFVAIIALAPMLKSNPLTATDKKLRARPGTERENVRALVSDTASSTPDEQTRGTREKPLEAWDAPKNWDHLKEKNKLEEVDEFAELAYSVDPAEGITLLQERLETVQEVEAIARIYTAMARLYAFRDPPDAAASALAFDHAAAVAPTAEARHEIARERIATLYKESAPDDVIALVDAAIRPDDATSLATLELKILKAAALETLTRRDEADTLFREVMEQAMGAHEVNGLGLEDIYRQAAMRLARSYRETGRQKEAEAIARDVRRLAEGSP